MGGYSGYSPIGAELRVEALTKAYDNHLALNNLSLSVAPGKFQALLGPSGSGKTTLLMSVAGFVIPDKGRILVDERDVTRLTPSSGGSAWCSRAMRCFRI